MSRVVVIGSYNHDHVWVVDVLPAAGATRLGHYDSGPGGKGFNQAVAAARAGASTTFITALGNDPAAETARSLAAAEGIRLSAEIHEDIPSGTAGIFVDAAGRNMIVVAPGANAALTSYFTLANHDDIHAAAVLLAQLEVNSEAVLSALQSGHKAGLVTVLNPAPANAECSPELLASADILTPNETEFSALLARHRATNVDADTLSNLSDTSLHALCRQLSDASVVITLGAAGVFVSHAPDALRGDHEACYRIGPECVEAIDSTGAGDAFSGALAAALAQAPTAPFKTAVRFANRFAALSTERRGAALAMPRQTEVVDRFG